LKRRWISIEASEDYIKGSVGRFASLNGLKPKKTKGRRRAK